MKYAYVNCHVLSGKKDMKAESGLCVLVDGEKITAVIPESEFNDYNLKNGEKYKKIDLGGGYLMPGLINMHVHLAGNGKPQIKQRDNAKLVNSIMSTALTRAVAYKMVCGFAKQELLGGVTTIRTVGGLADFDAKLRNEITAGKRVGPRVLASNRGISVPGGHMAGSVAVVAENVEQAVALVDESERENVDLIKLMITGGVMDAKEKGVPGELKMPADMVKAACDRAHKKGFKVAAHVESPDGVKVALENGVDSIEHGAKPTDEIIDLFKRRGAFLCTTISPAVPYALFPRELTGISETDYYNGKIVFDGIVSCAKAAVENDIPVVLGNDVGCPWITQYDFWRELCYFHKYAGVSNSFALFCATSNAAKFAGIGDITGSIEAGKCADFIVTKKNPLEDLRVLRNLEMVVARGKIIKKPKPKIKKQVADELDKYLN